MADEIMKGKKVRDKGEALKRYNSFLFEEEQVERKAKHTVVLELEDAVKGRDGKARISKVEIPADMLLAMKYAGEHANADYDAVKDEIEKLDEGLEMLKGQLGKDLLEGEVINNQIDAFVGVVERTKEQMYLNMALEWRGKDEFALREKFKEEFNFEEIKPIVKKLVAMEVGKEVRLEDIELGKALVHKNEVLLDVEGLGLGKISTETDEEILYRIRERDMGSHIEFRVEATKVKRGERRVMDLISEGGVSIRGKNKLYKDAIDKVPAEVKKRLGEEKVEGVLKAVVKAYAEAAKGGEDG